MTSTVIQTTSYPQPGGYPPPPQQGYVQTTYPQTGYPAQQPTVIHVPPTQTTTTTASPGKSERYNKKAGLVTGILQICAGVLLVILGIIVLSLGSFYSLGWSIWGSILFYIVAGILGVVSKNQNKCVIIAYMVMCIIAAVCAGSEMIYDCVAAATTQYFYYCDNNYYYGYPTYSTTCSREKAIMAMHSLSALTAFGEMIIAIVASAYCCSGVCGSSTPTQTTVVTYAQAAPAGQVTVVAPGSYPPPGSYPQGPPAYSQQQQQQQQPGQQQQQPGAPQTTVYEEPK